VVDVFGALWPAIEAASGLQGRFSGTQAVFARAALGDTEGAPERAARAILDCLKD
jgi:hypothetical protein